MKCTEECLSHVIDGAPTPFIVTVCCFGVEAFTAVMELSVIFLICDHGVTLFIQAK
jgi:hypothetical protein